MSIDKLILVLWVGAACAACAEDPPPTEDPSLRMSFFVDADSASGGDGSQNAPLQTVAAALAMAPPGATINVAEGVYVEQIRIEQRVELVGDGGVTLQATEVPTLLIDSNEAVVLESLTIHGAAVEAGSIVDLSSVGLVGGESPALTAADSELNIVGGRISGGQSGCISVEGGTVSVTDVLVESCSGFGLSATTVESLFLSGLELSEITGVAILLTESNVTADEISIQDVASDQVNTDDGHGISATGGVLTIDRSSFSRVETRGVVVRGGDLTITNSAFTGAGLTALAIMPAFEGPEGTAEILDCQFESNSTDVFVSGSTASITGCMFTESMHPILTDTSALVVERNVFEDIRDSFVSLIQPRQTVIRDNRGQYSDAACVFSSYADDGLEILNNTFTHCRGAGISVSDSADVEIADNSLEDIREDLAFPNVGDGLTIIDSHVRVANNRIVRTVGTGIGALRITGTIEGNDIQDSNIGGIQLTDCRQGDLEMIGNSLDRIVGPGFMVLNSEVVLRDNVAQNGTLSPEGFGDGIALADGSEATVIGNQLTDNARNGLVVLGGVQATIEDNTISNNREYGIRVYCESDDLEESDVILIDNEFRDNGSGETSLCD